MWATKLFVVSVVALLHKADAGACREIATIGRGAPASGPDHHRHEKRVKQFTAGVLLIQPLLEGLCRPDDIDPPATAVQV
jgi:hypothetical protein